MMKESYPCVQKPQEKNDLPNKWRLFSVSKLLFLFILLGMGGVTKAQTIQIGSGTSTTVNFPISSCYGYSYSQQIYLASELTGAGATGVNNQITKIRFKTTNAVAKTNSHDWIILLGETTQNDFTSTTDWIPYSALTEVFDGSVGTSTTVADEWFEIILTTPFNWNGTSNLVVAVSESTPSWNCTIDWQSYTASTNRGIYYRNDNTNPNIQTPPTATSTSPSIAQIQLDGTLMQACSGTPVAGTITGIDSICATLAFTLDGTPSFNSAITYQWQESPAGANNWSNIAGANNYFYSATNGITAATDYRMIITCTNGNNSDTSAVKSVSLSSPLGCYCTPTGSGNNSDEIRNFTLGNLSNSSAASEGVSGYSNYTTTVSPAQLESGASYAASLTAGTGSGNHGAAIWIDYNLNGIFEASERVAFLPSSIGANAVVTFPSFTVPASVPAGTYRLRVQYHYSKSGDLLDPCLATSSYSETEDYAVTVFIASCSSPSNLDASAIGSTTATISWDAPLTAPASGYEYYLSQTNTAPTASTVATGSVGAGILTENLTSLTSSTEYFVWVRSACSSSSKSIWTPATSFRTTQIPATIPFIEDFTNIGGWDLLNDIQTNKWHIGNATGNTGNSLYITNDAGASNTYTTGSASTVHAFRDVIMTGSNDFAFQFDWKAEGEGTTYKYDYFRVWVVPAAYLPVPGTQITAATDRVQIGPDFNLGSSQWNSENFTLPSSLSGQTARFVFEWRNDASSGAQPPAAIDNIQISSISCSAPTNITVTPAVVTAQVNWTAPAAAPANGYQYYYSTTNTAPTSGTAASGSTAAGITTTNITSLTASTDYFVWVRSICSSSDTSLWEGPIAFSTLCAAEIAPWTYDVEAQTGTASNSLVDGCWIATPNSTSAYAWNVSPSGTTPSSSTGPSTAHSGTKYFFAEASNGTTGAVAELLTPLVDVTALTTPALEFYYHMHGNTMGDLYIEVLDGTTWNIVDSLKGEQQPNQTDAWVKKLIPLQGYTGNIQVKFRSIKTNTSFYGDMAIDDISILEAPLACSGTPTAGIITTVDSICAGVDFDLEGVAVNELGITYQWQESPSGANTWTDISGATTVNYNLPNGILMASDFRLIITCTNGNASDTSNEVSVDLKPGSECYCSPISTSTSSLDVIANFELGTINNNTGGTNTYGYSDYTSMSTDLIEGDTYTANVTSHTGSGSHGLAIWIDYNDDGYFDISERLGYASSVSANSVTPITFTVPAGANSGPHRLRVAYRYNILGENVDPCVAVIHGETEDYTVNILPLSGCVDPIVNLGNDTTICEGTTLTLDAGNPGLDYVWSDNSTNQTLDVTASGVYYVTVSDSTCSTTDSIEVTVQSITVDLGGDVAICDGDTLTLDAGNAGADFIWNDNSTNQTLDVFAEGTYYVTVDDGTCSASDSVTVSFQGLPTADSIMVSAQGCTFDFSVANAENATNYEWNFGDGSATATGATVTHTYVTNSSFLVTLKMTNDCGDTATMTTTVECDDVGIGNITVGKDALKLYPNPAFDIITIENTSDLAMEHVTVFNVLGQVVYQNTPQSAVKHQMNVSRMASGLYTVRIKTNQGIIIRKFEILK